MRSPDASTEPPVAGEDASRERLELDRAQTLDDVPARSTSLTFISSMAAGVGLQAASLLLAMGALIGILAMLGYDAGLIVQALWDGSAGTPYVLEQSLSQSVPLLLSAVAVWLAFHVGLFNVGADGQLQVGGLLALVVAISLPEAVPAFVIVVAAIASGALAGSLWGAVAGVLRAYRGSNEVITTIMLNFIAASVVSLLIGGALRSETARFTPKTDAVPQATELGTIVPGIPWILVVAVVVSVLVVLGVERTGLGLRLRASGLNASAAVHAGMPVKRYQFLTFAASGALAGLAGALIVLGYRYNLAPGWAPPWGFLGILIAFLALRTPLLIPLWAVILGMIGAAGPALKGAASVPDSITTLMQTLPVIVLFVLYALGRSIRAGRERRATPIGDHGSTT